ncbi:MAG: AAA family ATPase [Candidatus Ancillula sp.]|jgi:DNA polymerase-3 subunit delta'|nr:AAA family ATPase [Candidatus Ancillula sp.]
MSEGSRERGAIDPNSGRCNAKAKLGYFERVVDQDNAVDCLTSAVENDSVSSTYLFCGPPGSGRSDLAYAFTHLLLGNDKNFNDLSDVHIVQTNRLSIGVKEVRGLISESALMPSNQKYRVFIIHDADRLTPEAQNALLKALEEPIYSTIWILLAPSSEDLLPTIRSRATEIHLKTPRLEAVVELLIAEGIDAETAEICALLSGNHVGIARYLSKNKSALDSRLEVTKRALGLETIADAVMLSDFIISGAKTEYEDVINERYDALTDELKSTLGIQDLKTIPPNYRVRFKQLDDERELAKKRAARDYIDIRLQQVLELWRDVMMAKTRSNVPPVNKMHQNEITSLAAAQTLKDINLKIDLIQDARMKLSRNCIPNLVLSSLFASMIIPKSAR